ncbi:MAG: DEAD/DEAH box helicase, partial [Boseongicola sp.]
MTGRPEALFSLFSQLETLPGVGPKTAKLFANMDVHTPRDLLMTLPTSGIDRRMRDSVIDVVPPQTVTVEVAVERHIPARQKGRPYRVDVSDAQSTFQLVFFHARPDFLLRQLPEGARRIVSGRIELFDGILQMVHPDHILKTEDAGSLPKFEPVYPLTHGITLKTITRAVAGTLEELPDLAEWIDPDLLARESWVSWKTSAKVAHAPKETNDLLPTAPARTRLAYDELFAHQVTLAIARGQRRRLPGVASVANGKLQQPVLENLPYRPTDAQMRAIDEVQNDLAADVRMNRLLQGDVGSGKTLVAVMALLTAAEAGGQGVMMAPTEILARQHFASLQALCDPAEVVVEILTGRDKGAERAAKLSALRSGDIQILLGTHAVFQKDVEFQDLRIAVIDEQHR